MRSIRNPILETGADPWLTERDGKWYFICTRKNCLELICAREVSEISQGEKRVVWLPPEKGPGSVELWAPELHWLDGRWIIYYAASDGTHDAGRRMHAVICDGDDPMKDPWSYLGMLNTAHAGLDGTVMMRGEEKYFLYAGYGDFPEHGSAVYIARMKDLITLTGNEVCLTRPEYGWERNGGMPINEGPAVLWGSDRVFVAYSASTTWSEDYCLGLLTAAADADFMQAESWTKSPKPVFVKSVEHQAMAPGHNCFCRIDGKDVIVYHAIDGHGGTGDLDTSRRGPRMHPVIWTENGTPDFGVPAGNGQEVFI